MRRIKRNSSVFSLIAIAVFAFGYVEVATAKRNKKKHHVNKQMNLILKNYLKITDALASDSTKGVHASAKTLLKMASRVQKKELKKQIELAAREMIKAKSIDKMRMALEKLSLPLVGWASKAHPKGVKIAHCPMALSGKGADWLQREGKISNPYYGSGMLRCGSFKK